MSIDYYQEKRLEIIRKRKLKREAEAAKQDAPSNDSDVIDRQGKTTECLDNNKSKHSNAGNVSRSYAADAFKKKKEKALADEYWNQRQKTFKSTKVTHVSADDYLKHFLASRSSSKKQDLECATPTSTHSVITTPGSVRSKMTPTHDHYKISTSNRSNAIGPTFTTMSSPSIIQSNIHPFVTTTTSKEDPLVKQMAFLAKRKKERLAAAEAKSNVISESHVSHTQPSDSSDEEEDLDIGLYEYSKRQRRKNQKESFSSDNSQSSNDNYNRKVLNDLKPMDSVKPKESVHPMHNDANLWSDSDASEIFETSERKTKASKSKKHDNEKYTSRRGKRPRQLKEGICEMESDEDEQFESDEILLQDLKPNLDNPTFEVGELEPFLLEPSMDQFNDMGQEEKEELQSHRIPASIARYIQPYQKEGITFMYQSIIRKKGCILGHDMGLGKTVQLISLLSALQEKTGTKLDLKNITERRKAISNEEIKSTEQTKNALLYGESISKIHAKTPCTDSKSFGPVLIIVPSSVIKNWNNEFETWGHFAVSTYHGVDKSNALNRIKTGFDDILICGKPTVQSERGVEELLLVPWKLVVVDEFHDYKTHTSQSYKSLVEIRNRHCCPIVGMTGTLMSNNHKELWTLVDLVRPGHLDDWTVFKREYERPIQLSRVKDAKPDAIRLGKERSKELHDALRDVYQKREKNIVLEDFLPTKQQVVMFCTPTDIQKQIYQHILQLPEYELLRKCNAPCDCGVNKEIFTNYALLTNR